MYGLFFNYTDMERHEELICVSESMYELMSKASESELDDIDTYGEILPLITPISSGVWGSHYYEIKEIEVV